MTATKNDDIDQLLRSYFRREMPARFPAAPIAEKSRPLTPPANPWTLSAGRFLVGASLAALLAMYLGVSAFFPRERGPGINPNDATQIGSKTGIPAKATK